jgi:DNA-binding CsgD family transcriptional regulator
MNAPEPFFERAALARTMQDDFGCFAARAIHVTTPDGFAALVKHDLQMIFPHGMLLAGIGHATNNGIVVERAIGINYPAAYVAKLKRQRIWAGPILTNWLKTNQPQLFDSDGSAFPAPSGWKNALQRHDLRNIAAHGVKDLKSHGASYFSFSQIPGPLTVNHARLLDMLVPLLHQALVRSIGNISPTEIQPVAEAPTLTTREIEILGRLATGNTSAEIASRLNRSEHTVKNQVRSVYQKLGVNNRAQAINAAIHLKLLPK